MEGETDWRAEQKESLSGLRDEVVSVIRTSEHGVLPFNDILVEIRAAHGEVEGDETLSADVARVVADLCDEGSAGLTGVTSPDRSNEYFVQLIN